MKMKFIQRSKAELVIEIEYYSIFGTLRWNLIFFFLKYHKMENSPRDATFYHNYFPIIKIFIK